MSGQTDPKPITLDEAAKRLGYKRTTLLARLKKLGWRERYQRIDRRKQRVIEVWQLVEIGRQDAMRLIEGRDEVAFRLKGQDETRRKEDREEVGVVFGALCPVYRFGPPGYSFDGTEPRFDLTVSLRDVHRYTTACGQDAEDVRREISLQLPGNPEYFGVRFSVEDEGLAHELKEIVRQVPIPKGLDHDMAAGNLVPAAVTGGAHLSEVQFDAYKHLRDKVIHRLSSTKSPESYLKRAVSRFYLDRLDAEKNRAQQETDYANEAAHLSSSGLAHGPGIQTEPLIDGGPPADEKLRLVEMDAVAEASLSGDALKTYQLLRQQYAPAEIAGTLGIPESAVLENIQEIRLQLRRFESGRQSA